MSLFAESIGRALDQLAKAAEDGLKKQWVLSFTAEKSGVYLEASDIEMTPADELAAPLLALEAAGSAHEVRARFLAAWAAIPPLSDHHGRGVLAAYEDSLGMGSNDGGGAGWTWKNWDEIA